MTDSYISLAKKRKSHELFVYVIIQACGTFVIVLGLLIACIGGIQNNLKIEYVGLVVIILGAIFSCIFALGGCARLSEAEFLPSSIQCYAWGGYLLLPCFMLSLFFDCKILGFILFFVIPLYGLIPQFCIARWLSKETKNDTMVTERDGTTNLD